MEIWFCVFLNTEGFLCLPGDLKCLEGLWCWCLRHNCFNIVLLSVSTVYFVIKSLINSFLPVRLTLPVNHDLWCSWNDRGHRICKVTVAWPQNVNEDIHSQNNLSCCIQKLCNTLNVLFTYTDLHCSLNTDCLNLKYRINLWETFKNVLYASLIPK